MKKFISTVLALGMAASLAACGGSIHGSFYGKHRSFRR